MSPLMPGSAPSAGASPDPGMPPGAEGGDSKLATLMPEILARLLSESRTADQQYPVKVIGNMKRLAAVMVANMDQSHPEVARHMSAAWRSLDQALKAAENMVKNQTTRGGAAGPPLGFSGASLATATPPGPMPGAPPPLGAM